MKKQNNDAPLLDTTQRLANRPGLLATLFTIGTVGVSNANYSRQTLMPDDPTDDRLRIDVQCLRDVCQADIDAIGRCGFDVLGIGTDYVDHPKLVMQLVERIEESVPTA